MTHFYKLELNNTDWEIPDIYEDLQTLASGNYGQVCRARVRNSNKSVAIKKLGRVFETEFDALSTYRELRLLKHINHKNVINLLDVFCPQQRNDDADDNLENFEHLYIVTPLVDDDLENILGTQELTEARIQFFVYQMLLGLKYLHSVGIVHRDIKPANIGVNEDCSVKILDFGYARPKNDKMTGALVSLWYGAPECAMDWLDYNESVDIWSVGCILAEMITGQYLFPGDDNLQQLHLMVDILGKPSEEFLEKLDPENGREYIESLAPVELPKLRDILGDTNPLAIDLIEKILIWDPEKRMTIDQALEHPYMQDYYEPASDYEEPLKFEQQFEDEQCSIEKWKELIYEEIVNFKPPEYYNEV